MKIKKGDKVVVLSGKDKGKVGNVLSVSLKDEMVVVEGVNLKTKHVKPSQVNPDGGKEIKEHPIYACKVALVDPKTKKATRVGYQIVNDKKVRVTKASGSKIA
ncbi:MAG: 50S ribosomal protein L24 [Erysipelotrichaceae bacterium]|nr:50S ribosomal protein L24 [Erysipelotrichaceae bacterium]